MSRTQFTQTLSFILLLSAESSFTSAQAPPPTEPEAKQAYELKVVLHLADNPTLTKTFGDRLERELGDSLQADFGDLVHVKVVRDHPLLKDVLEKGLTSALRSPTERDGVKTHFVLIDFNGVDYEIQSCQYDGVTGQANPVVVVETDRNPIVRVEKKRDREFVAKAAALMVERDFGLIASFPAWPEGRTKPQIVSLVFRGSDLAQLDRFVKKGDVFAVVQVPDGNGISQTIPDAVVQMEDAPKDGVGRGKLFWRKILPPAPNVSYRCVKLGTVPGPVRVRVVVNKGVVGNAESALQIRGTGFGGELQTMLKADTKGGLYDSSKDKNNSTRVFDQLAFVSVVEGVKGDIRAEVPVPLFSDLPYVIKLTGTQDSNALDDLEKIAWKTNVNDSFGALEYVFIDISKLLAAQDSKRTEIIEKGQRGVDRARDDYPRLLAKREELFKSPTPADQRDLKVMNERLKRIELRMKELTVFVETQKKIDTEEKSPEKVAWRQKVEAGKQLEKELDYEEAIKQYEAAAKTQETPELKEQIARLHKAWDTNDEEFKKARTFIYKVLPTLKSSTLVQMRLPEAIKASAECQRVGDVVAAQKLMLNISLLLPLLAKEGEGLNPVNLEDSVPLKRLKEIGEAFEKLTTDLKVYLDQRK